MRARAIAMALAAALLGAWPAGAGELRGRVTLGFEGAALADLGPTVVFLASRGGGVALPPERSRPTIRQKNARFDPEFLVVAAGGRVVMPNDDTIFHNVFSFSKPNDFDLGFYPAGESRTVRFVHPGLVKIYCSIHESMSAAVLVTPSPWHARVAPSGQYEIRGVPPGSYQLTVWNERLPEQTRSVDVPDGGLRVDLEMGSAPDLVSSRR